MKKVRNAKELAKKHFKEIIKLYCNCFGDTEQQDYDKYYVETMEEQFCKWANNKWRNDEKKHRRN